ncbi:MAG: hypothetical protein WC676_06735 [Candidatus Omnitrophota bacterium]
MKLRNIHALTLVEVMVTTGILAVIIIALQTVFTTGNMSWQTFEGKVTAQRQARLALMAMSQELREASNISRTETASSVSFTFSREGVGTVVYSWTTTGNDAGKLLRTADGTTRTLASDISTLSILPIPDVADPTTITINLTATKQMSNGQISSVALKEKIALR